MYHYFNAIHCKLTNRLVEAAEQFRSETRSKKAVDPDVDEICKTICYLLEDEGDAADCFVKAWNYHRFGDAMEENDTELPPIGIEEALVLAPRTIIYPMCDYVLGKCDLFDAVEGCLLLTYMAAFKLLGDKKGEKMPKELPSEEEVLAVCKKLDSKQVKN